RVKIFDNSAFRPRREPETARGLEVPSGAWIAPIAICNTRTCIQVRCPTARYEPLTMWPEIWFGYIRHPRRHRRGRIEATKPQTRPLEHYLSPTASPPWPN